MPDPTPADSADLDALTEFAKSFDGLARADSLQLIAELRSTRTAVPGPDQVVVDRADLQDQLDKTADHWHDRRVADCTYCHTRARLRAALSPDPSTETPA
jgi:hypothetical protein